MIEKFMNIEEEKRNRIISAAMKEFAQKGYKHATTDNIVEAASISKGLLFHYFGSKKNLYLFLYNYALDVCENKYLTKIHTDSDVFERIRKNTEEKIKASGQEPDLFNFLTNAELRDIDEKNEEMQVRKELFLERAYAKLFTGFDYSKFKDDIDPKQAIDIIIWSVEGHVNKVIKSIGDRKAEELEYDRYMEETNNYLDLLKKCFYK